MRVLVTGGAGYIGGVERQDHRTIVASLWSWLEAHLNSYLEDQTPNTTRVD